MRFLPVCDHWGVDAETGSNFTKEKAVHHFAVEAEVCVVMLSFLEKPAKIQTRYGDLVKHILNQTLPDRKCLRVYQMDNS